MNISIEKTPDPNPPSCSFIYLLIAGLHWTALLNRSKSVLIVAPCPFRLMLCVSSRALIDTGQTHHSRHACSDCG